MWRDLEEFPGYCISDSGVVCNSDTGRTLALQRNQRGIINVGLVFNGVQYKRSVALLVAQTFLDPPHPETFDTPIHLDGDYSNCRIENLMWRPRWFAILYHRQFRGRRAPALPGRIQERRTGVIFKNSWEAATQFGLIDREIKQTALARTYVWPTYQEFRIMED